MICSCSIPRTLSRTIRIDQALCRRKCPADGWTDGLWCKERRRGEQKDKKKKSVGLLKTVSKILTCLILDLVVSPSAPRVFSAEGENVAPCLTTVSGFALHIPAVGCEGLRAFLRACCARMCSPGHSPLVALSRLGRSRPVREALTPLSLMRVHADMVVYGRVSPRRARAHICADRCATPSIPLCFSPCFTHEVCA